MQIPRPSKRKTGMRVCYCMLANRVLAWKSKVRECTILDIPHWNLYTIPSLRATPIWIPRKKLWRSDFVVHVDKLKEHPTQDELHYGHDRKSWKGSLNERKFGRERERC